MSAPHTLCFTVRGVCDPMEISLEHVQLILQSPDGHLIMFDQQLRTLSCQDIYFLVVLKLGFIESNFYLCCYKYTVPRPCDYGVVIVERLLVSLGLGEYARNACGDVRFGCDLIFRGRLTSSDSRQYDGIMCNIVKDINGSFDDGCSVLREGGTTKTTNARTSLYANLLRQTPGRLFNVIGTTAKGVACVNTFPFAFGPGSPAR